MDEFLVRPEADASIGPADTTGVRLRKSSFRFGFYRVLLSALIIHSSTCHVSTSVPILKTPRGKCFSLRSNIPSSNVCIGILVKRIKQFGISRMICVCVYSSWCVDCCSFGSVNSRPMRVCTLLHIYYLLSTKVLILLAKWGHFTGHPKKCCLKDKTWF